MNHAVGRSLLTAKERVFLHLLFQQRFMMDPDSPKTVTQDGVSAAVNVGRNNVAKVLAEMGREGSVETYTRHVKGLPSVRKVYFLSPAGQEEAKRIKVGLEATKVEVIDLQGNRHQDEIGRLGNYLPKRYDLLELVNGIAHGCIDCRSFHENKMREERRYVDFTDKKPAVRSFYGREKELRTLSDLLTSESKRMVVINGIPGIGKTTLLAKFAQNVRDSTNVFWYKVHEWANMKAMLRPLAEFLSQMGRRNLEWYLNQTETPAVGEVSHILDADLKDVSALLIFDDVHKADPSVLELLQALLSVLEGLERVRVVCTARELPSFYPRGTVFRGLVEEINLEGLDRESSNQMMKARGLLDGNFEEIFRVTSGHPLFLELIDDPKLALGKNIRIFIEQEVFSRLGVAERKIMSIAAVFRYPVLIDAFFLMEEEIHTAAGIEKVELDSGDYAVSYEAVDSLLAKSIIYESVGRMIGMHDLLREFSLSRLTPRQRRVYHRAAAAYYLQDKSAPARVEGLYHSIMAGDLPTAVSIAAGDGRTIINKGYATQFAPLLDRLVRDMGGTAKSELVEINLLQGEVLFLQGEWDRAFGVLESLRRALPAERDGRVLSEVNRMIGVIHLNRADYDEAMRFLQYGMDISLSTGDLSTQADILYDIGGLMERRGQSAEALEHFERARSIALELADDLALGKALYGLGRTYSTLKDYDLAIRYKREALVILERRGDTNMMAKACISIGNDLCTIGNNAEGVGFLERSRDLANAVGDLSTMGHAMANMTGCKIIEGDLERADDLVNASLPISVKLDDPLMESLLHFYKGFIRSKRGERSEAKEEFHTSIGILKEHDSPVRLGQLLIEIADVSLMNNERDEAQALLQEAYDIANRLGHQKLLQQVKENMERLCT
ncbi:MAG: tetratricopeptide repeat protein [Methanomassiliicoccales archaeon]|nr:tetratricopeptide repeat protein [Methanomassiliicoccales archaeon]